MRDLINLLHKEKMIEDKTKDMITEITDVTTIEKTEVQETIGYLAKIVNHEKKEISNSIQIRTSDCIISMIHNFMRL